MQPNRPLYFCSTDLLPSGLRGLLLASLLAALITSLIGVLNSVSTLVVRDFIIEFQSGFS